MTELDLSSIEDKKLRRSIVAILEFADKIAKIKAIADIDIVFLKDFAVEVRTGASLSFHRFKKAIKEIKKLVLFFSSLDIPEKTDVLLRLRECGNMNVKTSMSHCGLFSPNETYAVVANRGDAVAFSKNIEIVTDLFLSHTKKV